MSRQERGSAFAEVEEAIGHTFTNKDLLRQAFLHRSYVNENQRLPLSSNERLEFLGDAVLGFLAAEMLYERFPDQLEGELTRLRAALVRAETLARIARELGLGLHMLLGHGEEASGGRKRQSLLAATFEAIVGALFLDRGTEATSRFVRRMIEPELQRVLSLQSAKDCKSHLQELTQAGSQLTPVYETLAAEGPDHAKQFTVSVRVGDRVLGMGRGRSKQEAEQDAARRALEAWTGH